MAITDMIPWKREKAEASTRREQEEDAFLDLRSQMNRLFDDFFQSPFGMRPFLGESGFLGEFAPQMDVSETEKEINVSAELPGLEPEDIHITVDQNALTISGEKRVEKEDKGKRYYRLERSYGSFHRSITLPDQIDEEKIEATFKRGVLKMRLPKTGKEREKGRRITVKKG
jgi:HSP20 family protein